MLFQLTPDDALKAIQSVSDDFPEAMEQIFSRVPEEQRIKTLNRLKTLISEDQLKEWARELLDGKK